MHPIIPLSAAATVLLASASAPSQNGRQYLSSQDLFIVSFPGEAAVRETLYETEYEIVLPARIYTVENGGGTYVLTAVDWNSAETIHAARFGTCRTAGSTACASTWRDEVRGSVAHAAAKFLSRARHVVQFGSYSADGVEGLKLEALNQDGSHTFAAIHWHEYRLYIVEATALAERRGPENFLASFGFIDGDGRRIQYTGGPYSPLFPAPQRAW